jgi:hypothetical protein
MMVGTPNCYSTIGGNEVHRPSSGKTLVKVEAKPSFILTFSTRREGVRLQALYAPATGWGKMSA